MSNRILYLSMIYMAEADGVMCKSEKNLIDALCEVGSENEVENVQLDDISVDSSTNSQDVLIQCLRLALVDGHYDDREKERFKLLARHLGVVEDDLEAIEKEQKGMEWLSSGAVIEMQ